MLPCGVIAEHEPGEYFSPADEPTYELDCGLLIRESSYIARFMLQRVALEISGTTRRHPGWLGPLDLLERSGGFFVGIERLRRCNRRTLQRRGVRQDRQPRLGYP